MTQVIVDEADEAREKEMNDGPKPCADTSPQVWLSGSGKKMKVTVHASPGTQGREVDFWIESDLKKVPTDPADEELIFNKTNNGMKKKDWYEVDFDLDDHSGLKLEFAPNPMLAFWVSMGSPFNPQPGCPQMPSYCESVYAISVNPSKLTVRNEDEVWSTFRFSLGFLKGGQDPKNQNSYVRYDPIGSNQDGGSN